MTRRQGGLDFESFCFQQSHALIRLLTLYCGDPEVARDLTQEALARAWVHWTRVKRMDRPEMWVRRVALNLAKSHFRRWSSERSAQDRRQADTCVTDFVGAETNRVVVRDAIARLSDRQRSALLLRYFEDLSVDETARVMNCGAGTVKKLTARGLVALRAQLGSDIRVMRDA